MVRLLLAISIGEHLDRHRRRGVRRLPVGHRQQAVHCRPICAAVVADFPDRFARTRHRGRGVRYLRLCDRVPLDCGGGGFRGSVRDPRMDARCRRGTASRAGHCAEGRPAGESLVRHLIVRCEDLPGEIERTEDQHAGVLRNGAKRFLDAVVRFGLEAEILRDFAQVAGREAGVVGDRRRCARVRSMSLNGSSIPGGSFVARLAKIMCSGLLSSKWCLA